MRRSFAAALAVLVLFVSVGASAQSSLYKKKKYFGAIPMNSVNVYIGFLDGPDHEYLSDHLSDPPAYGQLGYEVWESWSTSFYSRIGYQRQVAPRHFLVTNINFAYLAAEGGGEIGLTDQAIYVDSSRKLKTFLFSADLGFLYYMIKPTVRKIAPYIGGGFSAVLPYEKLESTFVRSSTGEVVDIPGENVSESSFEYGVYGQFGIDYFISNKWSAALDGRFQKTQSKFHIHGGNFDIDYSGLCLSLGLKYYF